MTIEQHEHAGEILELRKWALRNVVSYTESSNGFWANEYPPAKKRYLHKAEISQMAADRIYESYKKYILKHL